MNKKALFFDLDGTLACNGDPACPRVVSALHAAREQGNPIFLCTGRAEDCIYSSIRRIGFDGVIAGAGAVVTVGGESLYRRRIQKEELAQVLPIWLAGETVGLLEGESCTMTIHTDMSWGHLKPLGDPDAFLADYDAHVITKFTVYMPCDDALRDVFYRLFTVIDHTNYLEVLPKGCSKSDGMRRALECLNIPVRDSIAFGDSYNDLDILLAAGTGVAMGNAPEDIRRQAKAVTDTVDNAGVARWLETHLLKR